jgi:prevent-host-death family protein
MVTSGESKMKTTTVSKLKASLSEYLREVKAGEEVLVTERGRAIAKLTPAGSSATLPQHLAEMEKQGLIKVGSAKLPKNFWNLPRPKDTKGLVLKSLLQEREEGR